MLDCGTKWTDDSFWTPSLHYFKQEITALAPLNLDEDHIEDFGNVLRDCGVKTVITNPTIGPAEFRQLKGTDLGPGAEAYLKWLNAPKGVGIPASVNFGDMLIRWYYPIYGGANKCKTTNDLSLAVVCEYNGFRILFAGDLETNGWCALLGHSQFRAELPNINVLVASHHGRRSGCHDPAFMLMRPQAVIISDDEKEFETQETDAWYRSRCKGVRVIGEPDKWRYVMSTRKDNSMRINVGESTWTLRRGIQEYEFPRRPAKKTTLLTGNYLASPLGLSA
jgi:hypothetical protein